MSRDSRQLESVLHHDIPLTRDMGLKVLDWHDQQLRLHLPLEANVNHKSTCLLYTSPSPRDGLLSRMPSSA